MELGELDLYAIEAEYGKKGKGYVPKWKIELLQEAQNYENLPLQRILVNCYSHMAKHKCETTQYL